MTEAAGATLYRNCDWIVAPDAEACSHIYLRNADLAFSGKDVTFVGKSYDGPVATEIDGAGLMLIPGFVDIHSHPGREPGWKGMLEELGRAKLGQSSLYDFMPVFNIGPVYARHARRVAVSELSKSGATTICDLGQPTPTGRSTTPRPASGPCSG